MNSYELLIISKDSPGLQWILKNYYEFLTIITKSYGILQITMNSNEYYEFLRTLRNS